jgi:hypothetical protein
MFARPFPGAFVCLRCQSRLLRRRINTSLVAPSQRSTFAVLHPRFFPDEVVRDNVPVRFISDPEAAGSQRTRFPKERRLLGKVRGKRGGEVREDSASLSIDSLGEKAEVIILRDAGFEHKELEEGDDDGPEDISRSKQKLSHEAILKSIEDEKEAVDQEAINKQIDGLRPASAGHLRSIYVPLPLTEYRRICDILMESFTRAQLQEYCRMARLRSIAQRDQGERANISSDESPLATKSIRLLWFPWKAGTTPISQRPPKVIAPTSSKKAFEKIQARRGKKTLIDAIVRSYWGIDVAEETENAIGELEFHVKPHFLDLVTAGSKYLACERGHMTYS